MNKFYIILTSLFLLLSCEDNKCIEADDFGEPRAYTVANGTEVSSRYNQAENGEDFIENSKATYSNFVLDGNELKVKVIGIWSPWADNILEAGVCGEKYKVCNWQDDFDDIAGTLPTEYSVSGGKKFQYTVTCGNQDIEQNICWLPKGIGVYIGFWNGAGAIQTLYHLGVECEESGGDKCIKKEGNNNVFTISIAELNNLKKSMDVGRFSEIKVYSKIHDNYYADNINGCVRLDDDGEKIENPEGCTGTNCTPDVEECDSPVELQFISGVKKDETGFLESTANLFREAADNIIHNTFNSIVNSDTYINIYYLVWVLFITFYGAGYFLGWFDYSKKEFMGLVFRFGIVASFTNPDSWETFNQYIVSFFWDGSIELAAIVLNAATESFTELESDNRVFSGDYNLSVLSSIDKIIDQFFSSSLNSKIAAIVFSSSLGFIYVIALYVVIFAFTFAMIKLTVIFIFIILTLAILLSLAPLFFIFAIFKYTREKYFETWLQNLVGVSIQPMMLFTFVGIFILVINNFIYEFFYFRTCVDTVVDLLLFKIEYWKVTDAFLYYPDNAACTFLSSTNALECSNPLNALDNKTCLELVGKTATDIISTSDNKCVIDKGDAVPNISFSQIFLLLVSVLVLRYLMDKIVEVSETIAGGLSVSGAAAMINKGVSMGEGLIKKVTKDLSKEALQRTAGRAGIALANKVAPEGIAKHISGTDAKLRNEAKKQVSKELKEAGHVGKELQDKIKEKTEERYKKLKEIKLQKDKKYGRKVKNPLAALKGAAKQAIDYTKSSVKIAMAERGGRKLNKEQKRNIKEDPLGKISKDIEKKVEKQTSERKEKLDLKDSVAEAKGQFSANRKEASEALEEAGGDRDQMKQNLEEKGLSDKEVQTLMDTQENPNKAFEKIVKDSLQGKGHQDTDRILKTDRQGKEVKSKSGVKGSKVDAVIYGTANTLSKAKGKLSSALRVSQMDMAERELGIKKEEKKEEGLSVVSSKDESSS